MKAITIILSSASRYEFDSCVLDLGLVLNIDGHLLLLLLLLLL